MIAEPRDFGDLLVEHGAASAGGNRAEAEEAHARRPFALELAIELLPQALPARRGQSGDREVLEHRLLVVLDDVRRQFRFAAVLGLQESRFVEQDVTARHLCDARRAAAGVAFDPRLGHLVETELLDRLAIEVLRPARELQEDGIVRRDFVELLACELALVIRELRGRPAAEVVDPSAVRCRLRLRGNRVEHLLARVHAVEAQLHRPVGAFLLEVRVVVDEPRHD